MGYGILRELTHHQYLRERLVADFPDADEETLSNTLEGLTNLSDMLAEVLRSALDDQAMVGALRGRIGDMQARCGRIEERARKKRELVCSVMERADFKKLPSAPPITAHFMASAMKNGGGRKWGLSQSGMLIDFGTRPDTHFQNGQVVDHPNSKRQSSEREPRIMG